MVDCEQTRFHAVRFSAGSQSLDAPFAKTERPASLAKQAMRAEATPS
jgi:hypothetical protein